MKGKFCIATIMVAVFLCFAFFPNTVFGVEEPCSDINELLAPYKEVMKSVGSEFGYSPQIPEGEEVNVYNKLKDLTLEEFEESLRQSYADVLSGPETINVKTVGKTTEVTEIYRDGRINEYSYEENAMDSTTSGSSVEIQSDANDDKVTPMRDPVSRRYDYNYTSANVLYHVYVDVKVILNPNSFDSFVGAGYYTSSTQNYFAPNTYTHSLSASQLDVTYKGTVMTPTGLDLIVVKTLSVTYYPIG